MNRRIICAIKEGLIMDNHIVTLRRFALIPFCFLMACSNQGKGANDLSAPEQVTLPSAFANTNFCIVAGNWNESGAALIFDERLNPEIQTVSSHDEFYDIEFEALPLTKKEEDSKTMYFLPFNVLDQVIEDGYFKNGVSYKFWLSYENKTYFCGVSKNDDSLTEPELILTEGLM